MKLPKENVQFVDIPELRETFVDSIEKSNFRDGVAFIELCCTRIGAIEPPKPPKAKRYPVARLVLTPEAVIDLFNTLKNFVAVFQKEGMIQMQPPTSTSEKH